MNPIDAFLWVTAFTYYIAVLLPRKFKFLKNMGFITQKLVWTTMGTVWALCLTYTFHQFQWLILGVFYVAVALMSYTGIQDWGSPNHNLAMMVWDLLIAVICLSKL